MFKLSLPSIKPTVRLANYFNVPPNMNWLHHRTKDLELILIVRGRFKASDPDHETTTLEPGDVLLIRPGYACRFEEAGAPGGLISCIHFELLEGKRWADGDYRTDPPEPWVVKTGSDSEVLELFRRCADEYNTAALYRKEIMSSIITEIWIRLMRHAVSASGDERSGRLEAMVAYLRRNAITGAGRRELAREFHLTPEYVNQLFKECIGMTPGEVVQRERISRAVQLLAEGKHTVTEVAFRVGFSDPQYFSRVFQKVLGRPPSSCR